MVTRLIEFISSEKLFVKSDKILIAVSGGVDSVLMAYLFADAKFDFAIAHCNFALRGEESEEDEKFVRELSEKLSVKFYSIKFETEKYAVEKKLSIQMAARELRYEWFEKIREENNYSFIVTAHHLNDSIETTLLNCIRGTGISGLHGILPKQNKIIRPLLFLKKSEIEKYVEENKIKYRLDSSNESDKYTRNKIRNQVIPLLKEINPYFENSMAENLQRVKSVEHIYLRAINEIKGKLFEKRNKEIYIPIRKLLKYLPDEFSVFEIMKEFNFNSEQVKQIISSFENESGKIFLSSTHRLIKDRLFLIISQLETNELSEIFIEKSENKIILHDLEIKINTIENKKFKIPSASSIACIDFDLLEFPLKLKKWSKGDYFYPLGMKKKKKLSNFFIDKKMPLSEKEKTWVLFSGEKAVWVVNHRLDERFKITDKTKNIFTLECKLI